MGKRFVEGEEIVAKTPEGVIVKGREVIIEDDDTAGRAALTVATMGIGALSFAAGPNRTRCVDTGDGNLHRVEEVIREAKKK